MKLATDDRGRLAGAGLLRPNCAYDAEPQPDGSIRVVELATPDVPVVKPRIVAGRLRGAAVQLPRNLVAAAIRAERDAR